MNAQAPTHAFAPNQGRNVHCTCGAEYSLAANLNRHIDRENATACLPGMNPLQTRIAGMATSEVRAALEALSGRDAVDLSAEERIVHAALADDLTRRWGLAEADIDVVFQDEAFDGTYLEALVRAREVKASRDRVAGV